MLIHVDYEVLGVIVSFYAKAIWFVCLDLAILAKLISQPMQFLSFSLQMK